MKQQHYTEDTLLDGSATIVQREIPVGKKVVKRRIGFFTGNERHDISLADASEFTKNYRRSSRRFGQFGTYFGREIFEKILDQGSCVGIRIYYAKNFKGKPTVVITGAQSNNRDIQEGILGQECQLSTECSPIPNQLNSDSSQKMTTAKKSKKVLTGKENHFVTLAEAVQLTRRYQESIEYGEIKGGFFGSGIFRKILAQPDCAGIRIYHAMHNDGKPTFVLVGVDEFGYDLLYGVLGQGSFDCPPWCWPWTALSK